jgi:hypothetical protein
MGFSTAKLPYGVTDESVWPQNAVRCPLQLENLFYFSDFGDKFP